MANWKELLEINAKANGDIIRKVCIAKVTVEDEDELAEQLFLDGLDHELLSKEFDAGYGAPEGAPFTAWGDYRVYFPCTHDGAEWVYSVPRNPTMEVTHHVGSW